MKNLKEETLFIEKEAGNYNRIYNEHKFLNLDIVSDIPDLFAGFLIDLRDIKSHTIVATDKSKTIDLFEKHLDGIPGSAEQLKASIAPSSCSQYTNGI